MSTSLIYTIDDDKDFNMLLKLALQPFDIKVVTHTSVAEFTQSVKKTKPDVCILDLNLDNRGGEGFQLVKAMRNVLGSELPIFIMSKRGASEDVMHAMKNGATDFIAKPLDDMYLILKLKHFLPENKKVQEVESQFAKVPSQDAEITLYTDFKVKRISLNSIDITGDLFLLKNMVVSLESEFIQDVFSTKSLKYKVIDSHQVDETIFAATLTRTYDREEFFALRRWLIIQEQHQKRSLLNHEEINIEVTDDTSAEEELVGE